MSVQKQVKRGTSTFTEQEIVDSLALRALLKDSDIESDYKSTDISNLALVLGYMQALKISKSGNRPGLVSSRPYILSILSFKIAAAGRAWHIFARQNYHFSAMANHLAGDII